MKRKDVYMTKKKIIQSNVSQEELGKVQQVIENYHHIATSIHHAKEQTQLDAALVEINALTEDAQIALLKVLARQPDTDSADVLSAVYELNTLKNVRKEARRALIQLEGAKVYPTWSLPAEVRQSALEPIVAIAADDTTSYRFWKGYITDSLDVGEAQLLLAFEQENDPNTVRVFGFLLEFVYQGVKDFFTRVESKRKFEKFYMQMASGMPVTLNDCSLDEGRENVLQALEINKQRGTQPHRDYRLSASLVNRLVLNNPDA
jgi:hypothetical protein